MPAQELFTLMREVGAFQFLVFDFTVVEMSRVLRNYSRRQHMYVNEVQVDSIHSSLKAKGWTPADVRQFIATIESRLWDEGIGIQPTRVDLDAYEPHSITRATLAGYKDQPLGGQTQDLAAIDFIRGFRQRAPRRIEEAQAIFLSEDVRLTACDLIEHKHEENGTISEVMLDRVLGTLLWLKDPGRAGDISLSSIISLHSRDLLISREVWDRFFDTVRQLREARDISDADVGLLVYDATALARVALFNEAGAVSEETRI